MLLPSSARIAHACALRGNAPTSLGLRLNSPTPQVKYFQRLGGTRHKNDARFDEIGNPTNRKTWIGSHLWHAPTGPRFFANKFIYSFFDKSHSILRQSSLSISFGAYHKIIFLPSLETDKSSTRSNRKKLLQKSARWCQYGGVDILKPSNLDSQNIILFNKTH